jgi:hypothetical protein
MYFARNYTLLNFQANHEYYSHDGRLITDEFRNYNGKLTDYQEISLGVTVQFLNTAASIQFKNSIKITSNCFSRFRKRK